MVGFLKTRDVLGGGERDLPKTCSKFAVESTSFSLVDFSQRFSLFNPRKLIPLLLFSANRYCFSNLLLQKHRHFLRLPNFLHWKDVFGWLSPGTILPFARNFSGPPTFEEGGGIRTIKIPSQKSQRSSRLSRLKKYALKPEWNVNVRNENFAFSCVRNLSVH